MHTDTACEKRKRYIDRNMYSIHIHAQKSLLPRLLLLLSDYLFTNVLQDHLDGYWGVKFSLY